MKRIALALALVIMSASLAFAQAPDPVPVEGEHGAAYLSYGYTSGAAASLDNLQFDFDLALPGTVVSFAGHFTDSGGAHVGPSGSYQVGPINIFGRHLFLTAATSSRRLPSGTRRAAGSRCRLWDGAILRIGLHNYQHGTGGLNELAVGIGARF